MASILLSLGLLLATGWSAPVSPAVRPGYSSLVVFGDSFSDNGKGYARINHVWPSDPAYYKGRFSNGPVWPEDLAEMLSIPLYDYAQGGATTDNAIVEGHTGPKADILVPSLTDQVADFLAKTPVKDLASSLVILFGGVNDVLGNSNISAARSAGVIGLLVRKLRDAGAVHFILVNVPDLSLIPYDAYIEADQQDVLRDYAEHLGYQLRRVAQRITSASVKIVDLIPLFRSFNVYDKGWKAAGFDKFGLYGSCLVGGYSEAPRSLCKDPDRYVFWDEYHPSRRTHALIAEEIRKAL
ncbi:hypothetical protein CDD80_6772 [Ophiocordyceps camponoti-rufipedis]|uniref:SGNH hydrolase-type esterase domain-containing protein n=1 Tax=Ophiocordyceps camponoti-rufipedis TaxID=2004952 RepID=A0A2C5YP58_9HYPO|nr:hypothetical protein CDD80_6772 [Ophiocordyceps camponoti-rufipedis]